MAILETIRGYGNTHEWVPLVIDEEEIILAGHSGWLQFVWLSNTKEQQYRVYKLSVNVKIPRLMATLGAYYLLLLRRGGEDMRKRLLPLVGKRLRVQLEFGSSAILMKLACLMGNSGEVK